MDIVSEVGFGTDNETVYELENATSNSESTACIALAWIVASDVRLAAAYYNPSCPCKILLWDALAASSRFAFGTHTHIVISVSLSLYVVVLQNQQIIHRA